MRHRHIIVNPIALKFHDGIRTRDVSAVRASEGAEPKPLFCFANLLMNKKWEGKDIHFNTTTSLTLNLSTNVEAR